MNKAPLVRKLSLVLLALTIGGCIGGSSPTSNFYLLEPVTGDDESRAHQQSNVSIALMPVRVPEYIDRPQIVMATGPNTYHLSEFDRWAEGLPGNLNRVLTQNLAILVPADVWQTRSSNQAKKATFGLRVEIFEFHIDPAGRAKLTVRWMLSKGDELLLNRQTTYLSDSSKTDYRLMVESLNKCWSLLSRDIAQSLHRFTP